MTMRVTMLQSRYGAGGALLAAGSTYSVSDEFGAALVGWGFATDTDGVLSAPRKGRQPLYVDPATGVVSDQDGNPSSVSGDWFDPVATWANLPAASASGGKVYRVADVGPVGSGSFWVSDGTRWRPLGGRQLHCSAYGTLAAPLATLSAVGKFALPDADRVSGGSILLPIGLPQIGQGVQVVANFVHRGTAGAWNVLCKIGTTNAVTDGNFGQGSGTSGQDSVRMEGDMAVATATTFVTSLFSVPNQATSGGQVLRNTNFNNAVQQYIIFSSSSLTAGDFLDLISYEIYLKG